MFTLGKRPLVRRRGRGGMQFRAPTIGKLKPAKYPVFELAENIEGEIIDLVHEKVVMYHWQKLDLMTVRFPFFRQ